MNKTNNLGDKVIKKIGADFFEHSWEKSWTYIKTVVDVVHEPILILNKEFRVMAANQPFYGTFQVDQKETENKVVYELGNGQWNIPALKKLLENILPKNTFFKGFEVSHDFPVIGKRVMILNARQIYFKDDLNSELFPPIILLAMEDVTIMMDIAKKLADRTNKFESEIFERTESLEDSIKSLKNEIKDLRKK